MPMQFRTRRDPSQYLMQGQDMYVLADRKYEELTMSLERYVKSVCLIENVGEIIIVELRA